MKLLRVGVIGLGTIGSRLVEILAREFAGVARVVCLCDLDGERAEALRRRWAPRARITSWSELVRKSDLIVEAASQAAASRIAPAGLKHNKEVLILSVGGLLVSDGLKALLKKTKGRIWIPSGALAGVDGLLAARQGKIKRVTLTTRKPVRGLEGAPYLRKKKIHISRIKKPTLIFEGTAAEAIRVFPKNINVAATLALAGIGARRTRVRIITSPHYRKNRHEVLVEGDFGRIRTEVENVPSKDNPRTSELAILSAKATLHRIFSRFQIGT